MTTLVPLDVPAVLAALSLEEKASLCSGADFWNTKAVERAGVPAVMLTDGPHGLRKQATSADHVGLTDSVPATCFPPAVALGSSFDADLVERIGRALGAESRTEHVAVLLGPGINIKRSPLCGRNFEYLSEDPLLSGLLGAALVRGIQSAGVGACVKHFAANNQETDRARVSAEVDERTLREIYLAGFERVVTEAMPWMVMCSYNKVNGTYASQHPWLLTDVLRTEWGFDGVVVSDWGAVNDRVAALRAGLDLQMPATGGHVTDAEIVAAVRAGDLDEAVLDRAVERILTLLARSLPAVREGGAFDVAAHHALAREAAADCAVLLKNDPVDGVPLLPLDPAATVAVIGEFARTPRYQGAGSSQVNPTRLDDAWTAIRELAGDRAVFAPGFGLEDSANDEALRAEAVEAARGADVAVLFLGLPASHESEGFDRRHILLPAAQTALLAAVAEVNPRVVVVLANGSTVQVSDWAHHAAAILEGWLLGQAGGGAIADLLAGRTNPSGRLAETVPLRLQDNPSYLNFPGELGVVRYGEGVFVGYRGFDAREQDVSYPFGHGLSYTTFGYSDLDVTLDEEGGTVSVTVANTGSRAGKEVVQVYVAPPASAVARPVRELRAFAKVALEPGESRRVALTLTRRDLSYFDPRQRRWVVEAGEYAVAVGASSRDLRLTTTVTVTSPEPVAPLAEDASLEEWLAHPVGSRLLAERLADAVPNLLTDPEMRQVVGNFPLARLATFPGAPMTPAEVEDLRIATR
ncbi:glycoside hydrolase family 3 C-terminal domain-containing protein [Pseudonocardia cypriaca]|uniref:Exo-alpha-(1->6)-L-arabinopyranosidase n=1 Tax=Pseudonocardia cypriaca TaxID=882449 RepID=A0A543FRN3_9PSEU|nr:glycoside hydrolase family 3 C-terminal domain-containing protein [Pseudonocardia cypriaca]TQM36489.1 beta-glucosidase [Pseudonocardia cypriaca]